jgi:hypothetical protein
MTATTARATPATAFCASCYAAVPHRFGACVFCSTDLMAPPTRTDRYSLNWFEPSKGLPSKRNWHGSASFPASGIADCLVSAEQLMAEGFAVLITPPSVRVVDADTSTVYPHQLAA